MQRSPCIIRVFLLIEALRGGGTLYNGLYGEAPPERGIFFRLQLYEREGILLTEVYKG